ncbi:MAG: bifunctional metallophosphatase/5'-nucleotidase [Bacteroidales bacterium]|nr:bifunctional metallophosphatase/5'-nucleotidase [Bacteroidales bacterium]MCM1147263.1 bifunctional metallophosphatase/5'-nucleotidase [Bacteroidales bacterium]MCM1206304.1 bifunctional metallophosphatase/5'-nucleotidase [Bacillota bacterium]MCM1510481.1 bifunctional metallophosphatase/5'-nucleotidase [Clostridium sp.]
MRKIALFLTICLFIPTIMQAKKQTVTLHIIETSDVHGCFFPWDFINKRPMKGTLARVSTYINKVRNDNPDGVILLENGDIMQGQPINYFYNYINSDNINIAAQCVNYLKYDAQNWGNHDTETGHACYDKWGKEVNAPVLGANVIDNKTGKPYLKPYTIIERQGVKVAVIGMITPAIPNWLPETLWSGLTFTDMVTCARQWVETVKKEENPDIIIGLFHAGLNGGITTAGYDEDASERVAKEVPGFDAILFGHDHRVYNNKVINSENKEVLLCNPANNAQNVADVTISLTRNGKKILSKNIEGKIVDVRNIDVDNNFMTHFAKNIEDVKQWADRKIGTIDTTITTRDSFFGSSAFTDLIHNLQMSITGADISLNAPLTFNATLAKGDITIADMFNLYKFENQLYTMMLSGEEIRKHLEMSYNLWINTMTSPDDHIMMLDNTSVNDNQRSGFKNMTFNFDSAAGIIYTVDVTKPYGKKINIISMADGTPFDENKMYKVAVNSYRGNGGGELLTRGAGIPKNKLDERIVARTEHDQRWYLMKEIERRGNISPEPNNNWKFIPEEWAKPAIERDRKIIFGE